MSEQETIYYKVLREDRMPCHGGSGQWPSPGVWREIEGDLVPCKNGLHVCTIEQLPYWLDFHTRYIWTVDIDGSVIKTMDKVVVSRARLREQSRWDNRIARRFLADCAEHVLPIYEDYFPDDARPRLAIEAARRYADGSISRGELDRARIPAWEIVREEIPPDAWSAALAAASTATVNLLIARTLPPARAAVTMRAAETTGLTFSARSAEHRWQVDRLFGYLHGGGQS